MKKLAVALVLALATLATVLAAPGSSATQAQEPELGNVFMVSPNVCLALTLSKGTVTSAACLAAFGTGGIASQNARNNLTNLVFDENEDGTVTREEVNAFVPFTGNMVHQDDEALIIVAFVDDDNRVAFQTDEGGLAIQGTTVVENFVCDQPPTGPGDLTMEADEDCDGDGTKGDGLLYAQLLGHGGDLGDHVLNVFDATNGEVIGDAFYRIVGEPEEVSGAPFETILQAGLHPSDCTLPGGASGFTDALGTPEKTIIFGKVVDGDEQAITGAWITWTSSDDDILKVASGTSPTLDLGSFGVAAPNILCGINPGTATLTLKMEKGPVLAGAVVTVDPGSDTDSVHLDITVLPPPSAVALAATPATVDCNGTNTAAVAASVSNEDGDAVVDGTHVDFSVLTLGTVAPLHATTVAGVATGTVTPLSGNTAGVTVIVSVPVGPPTFPTDLNNDGIDNDNDNAIDEGDEFNLNKRVTNTDIIQTSIIVSCTQGGGTVPPPPPPTGGSTPGTGSSGGSGVTPPDTGSGGQAAGTGSLPMWPVIALFVAAMALAGARFAVKRTD